MRSSKNPLENTDGTLSSQNSCFKASVSEIPPGEPLVVGLEHPGEIHQDIVILVQDLLTEVLP